MIFVGILCLSFLFQNQIENYLNSYFNETSSDVSQCEFKVHYIDVGQGDAIAIEFPNNEKMLIDSGAGRSVNQLTKYLRNNLFWNDGNILDYFLITHPHEDHIGGGVEIFETFEVENFYRPMVYTPEEYKIFGGDSYNSKIFKNVVKASVDEGCEVFFFDSSTFIEVENCLIEFMSPLSQVYDNVNNYSPIMKLTYRSKVFMFTGDVEKDVEKSVIKAYPPMDLKADVLKVGHHGSNTSSCEDFIKAVRPAYSIISVGAGNKYNHPTQTVLDRLKNYGSKVYRTDLNGNIIFAVDDLGKIVFMLNKQNNIPIRIELWYLVLSVGVAGCYLILTIKIKKSR